jgi:hypothetical protein
VFQKTRECFWKDIWKVARSLGKRFIKNN